MQDTGLDTVEANVHQGLPSDARTYEAAAAMLLDLGLDRVRVLTNNPAKCDALEGLGIAVTERVPLVTIPHEDNLAYLLTKQRKMGHRLGLPDEDVADPGYAENAPAAAKRPHRLAR